MQHGTNNKTKSSFPIKNPMLAIVVNNSFSELENMSYLFAWNQYWWSKSFTTHIVKMTEQDIFNS